MLRGSSTETAAIGNAADTSPMAGKEILLKKALKILLWVSWIVSGYAGINLLGFALFAPVALTRIAGRVCLAASAIADRPAFSTLNIAQRWRNCSNSSRSFFPKKNCRQQTSGS